MPRASRRATAGSHDICASAQQRFRDSDRPRTFRRGTQKHQHHNRNEREEEPHERRKRVSPLPHDTAVLGVLGKSQRWVDIGGFADAVSAVNTRIVITHAVTANALRWAAAWVTSGDVA